MFYVCKGYCTGMINAYKDGNTSHDTRPFLLATSFLSQKVIKIWIQQTNHSCSTTNHTISCS